MAIISLTEVSKRTGLNPKLIVQNEKCGWFPRRTDHRGWHEEEIEMWRLTEAPPMMGILEEAVLKQRDKVYRAKASFLFGVLFASLAVGFLIGRYLN